MSHVVHYRVLSHVLRLHSNKVLKLLAQKRYLENDRDAIVYV